MIGLYLDWQGRQIERPTVRRFTGSLGAGLDRAVGHQCDGNALLATHCESGATARAWQACKVPAGGLLLFKGRIDNGDALRRDLGVRHRDAEALYAAGYTRWGDAVDLRVIGQFATIIAFPDERRVRCARSPLQAPPLHIWHDRERVIVASLARILFAGGDVVAEVDEQKIADSLYLNYAEAERGWYRNVARVATGCHVSITPGGIASRRYYDSSALPRIRLKRDSDYVEAANALLMEGTRAALAGRSTPAISLSGGLDSQGVAAFAIDALGPGKRLLGLTSVPEAGWGGVDRPGVFGDERHHVAMLAAMYPTLETETVDAAGLSFDHKLAAMFLMAGAVPRAAMNLPWIHSVLAGAAARRCDVVLLGAMGNLSFSFDGTGALPSWFAHGHWLRLRRELNAIRGDRSLARTFTSQALLPFLPAPVFRRVRPAADDPLQSWSPLNPDYARAMKVRERALDMGHDTSFRAVRSSRAYRASTIDNAMNESGETRQALELIHGIPLRDPTAYRPLVEFCFGIPDDQFLRGGQRRWLARRMLQGRIPDMVLNETRRGRQAVDWPLRIGRDRAALIDELDALARDPAMAHRLDLPRLRAALERWSPDLPGNRESDNLIQLALPRAIATARFIRFVEGSN